MVWEAELQSGELVEIEEPAKTVLCPDLGIPLREHHNRWTAFRSTPLEDDTMGLVVLRVSRGKWSSEGEMGIFELEILDFGRPKISIACRQGLLGVKVKEVPRRLTCPVTVSQKTGPPIERQYTPFRIIPVGESPLPSGKKFLCQVHRALEERIIEDPPPGLQAAVLYFN
jgi:hypothetical protein